MKGYIFSFGGDEPIEPINFDIDELPPEIAAFVSSMRRTVMPSLVMVDLINETVEDDEPEQDDAQVKLDHENVERLMSYMSTRLGEVDEHTSPLTHWNGLSDGDKLRLVVVDLYSHAKNGPTCVHRDRVEQALLVIADRLDMADIEGRGA